MVQARRAGPEKPVAPGSPYGLQLAGCWEAARAFWLELGCPYESALSLADADSEEPLRRALEELQALDRVLLRRSWPDGYGNGVCCPCRAALVRRRARTGTGSRPRAEVLALVNRGLQNGQIADRLVVSVRTVDHHVEAILRKLGAKTRADAGAIATSLGIALTTS